MEDLLKKAKSSELKKAKSSELKKAKSSELKKAESRELKYDSILAVIEEDKKYVLKAKKLGWNPYSPEDYRKDKRKIEEAITKDLLEAKKFGYGSYLFKFALEMAVACNGETLKLSSETLKLASERLRGDKEVVSDKSKDNKEEVEIMMKVQEIALESIERDLAKQLQFESYYRPGGDREVEMMAAAQETVLKAIKRKFVKLLKLALYDPEDNFLPAVRMDGNSLKFVSDKPKEDKEVGKDSEK